VNVAIATFREEGISVQFHTTSVQVHTVVGLYGLKMAEASNLSQHINVFNRIIGDLKRVDVKFENEDKALMLLNSLPTSSTYENLVTTLT
jgi:hypothetical protein